MSDIKYLKPESYYETDKGILLNGDTIDQMKRIKNKSIDCIIADLPYGVTSCKWDTVIPFDQLWHEYERIIKNEGAVILFGTQPFTSALVMSNPKLFKYSWVWDKVGVSNAFIARKQPLRSHEDICVFYKKQCTYNPQMTEGKMWNRGGKIKETNDTTLGKVKLTNKKSDKSNLKFPKTIIRFSNADKTKLLHNTQKPLELIRYLIRTYINENDLILDNTSGSGTLAIGCELENRKWICIEKEQEYCDITINRLKELKNT